MSFLQCMVFLIVVTLISSATDDIESTTQSIADRVTGEIRKLLDKFYKDEKQLKIDREELEKEKEKPNFIDHIDVLQLNVGGEIIITTRQTLTKIPKSMFYFLFYGRWEHKLQRDHEGNIFLDFNPIVFRHLLDQLQIIETNNLVRLYPPVQPSLIEPFKKMLKKLDLHQFLSSEKQNVITLNVGGQTITNRRSTFNEVSNSTFDTIISPSKIINFNNQGDVFLDYNPKLFQHLINQLRKESFKSISPWELSSNEERTAFKTMLNDLSIFVVASTTTTSTSTTNSTSTTTTSTTTANTITYSQSFTHGVTSTSQCLAWTTFVAQLTVRSYTLLQLSGSNDPVGVTVTDTTVIANIALALRTSTSYGPVTSNSHSWIVGFCGGSPYELSANGKICSCSTGYTIRPCIGNSDWGGINGTTCRAATQTITVLFQYG